MSHPHHVMESYVHSGRIGVLLEMGLDTSFTAGLPEFKKLGNDLALQIAAAPVDTIEELLVQVCVKDNALTVAQLLVNTSRRLGERIAVTRFVRWDTEVPQPSEPPRSPAIAAMAGKVA